MGVGLEEWSVLPTPKELGLNGVKAFRDPATAGGKFWSIGTDGVAAIALLLNEDSGTCIGWLHGGWCVFGCVLQIKVFGSFPGL